MVLTANQKKQLNLDILEYLANNDYPRAAEIMSEEIGVALGDVDPEGNKLELKWKSILALQKKIKNLEEQVKNLQEELDSRPNGPSKPNPHSNAEELFIPKQPPKLEMKGHKGIITSLAFHPQYTQLATSAEDGTVKVWEFDTGDIEKTLRGHTNPVNHVSYDPQGRYLASCSSDLSIKLWDLTNDYQCFKTLFGHNHNVSYVAFHPQDDLVLSCSRDKTIKLWEVSSGYCQRTYTGHEGWVRRLSVAKDGQSFISGSDDQSICVWSLGKDTPILRFFAHDNVIETVLLVEGESAAKLMNAEFLKHKFTPEVRMNALKQLNQEGANGVANYYQSFILTAGRDKLIKLFLSQTGQHLHTFHGHDNWVRCLSLHSSGRYLYSAGDDKTIRVWDLNFGKQKKKVQGHQHFVSTVQFNSKYMLLASSGNDMVIKLWQLKELK